MRKFFYSLLILMFSSLSYAQTYNPAYVLKRERFFNAGATEWGSCRVVQCQSGYVPSGDGLRCTAPEDSGGALAGGQVLDKITDPSSSYTMYYSVGSVNQGSSDPSSNYTASSNLDVPTSTAIDQNSNYKLIIGVQK